MLDRKGRQWGTGSSPSWSHFSAMKGRSWRCRHLCSYGAHVGWKWIAQREECLSKSKVCTAEHCSELLRARTRESCASTCHLWILWDLNPVSCTAGTPRLHRLQDKGKTSGQDGDGRRRGVTVKKRSHPDTHLSLAISAKSAVHRSTSPALASLKIRFGFLHVKLEASAVADDMSAGRAGQQHLPEEESLHWLPPGLVHV